MVVSAIAKLKKFTEKSPFIVRHNEAQRNNISYRYKLLVIQNMRIQQSRVFTNVRLFTETDVDESGRLELERGFS